MLPDFRVRQRDYLLEITRSLTQELNLERLLVQILKLSAEILAGQAGIILLRADDGTWRVSTSHGINPAFVRYLDPLLAKVPLQEDAARFELPEVNRLLQGLTRKVSLGLLTGIGLPLTSREKVIGVIFIFRSYAGRFTHNEASLLQSFADQAAIAVNNAQLYRSSQQERQRMSGILDSVADGMLILRPNHTIERVNPSLAAIFELPVDWFLQKQHGDVIRWLERNQGMSLAEAEAGGWPLNSPAAFYVEGEIELDIDPESEIIRSDSGRLPVGISYSPVLSPDGNLLNIICVIRDLSRFREAEELKDTFISVVSHELKTPVALIKGYVSTLRRDDATWEADIVQDSLEVIEEEADRLNEMIENLLDASRLQAGGLTLNRNDVAVPALVARMVDRLRSQTGHAFSLDFDEFFPIILGDEDRLSQVFSNLIGNAIKYSPEAGEIRISGRVRPNQVHICVSDDGAGIALGDIPHVFDRFYRANRASKTTKGAGLGLYLSRAVVEAHGGRIWVDPRPGEGARICLSLPRQE
jgi:signal transduction histidine kinase